jgi:hypothetical protein
MPELIDGASFGDIKKCFLTSVATDGHESVTLVFETHASDGGAVGIVDVILFEAIILEANWHCGSDFPNPKSVNLIRTEPGVVRLELEFTSGKLVFRCADCVTVKRTALLSPWPGGIK